MSKEESMMKKSAWRQQQQKKEEAWEQWKVDNPNATREQKSAAWRGGLHEYLDRLHTVKRVTTPTVTRVTRKSHSKNARPRARTTGNVSKLVSHSQGEHPHD